MNNFQGFLYPKLWTIWPDLVISEDFTLYVYQRTCSEHIEVTTPCALFYFNLCQVSRPHAPKLKWPEVEARSDSTIGTTHPYTQHSSCFHLWAKMPLFLSVLFLIKVFLFFKSQPLWVTSRDPIETWQTVSGSAGVQPLETSTFMSWFSITPMAQRRKTGKTRTWQSGVSMASFPEGNTRCVW